MIQTHMFDSNIPMGGDPADAVFYMAASVLWSFAYLLFMIGALCTLFWPSRGIQDFLAGTSLVPR